MPFPRDVGDRAKRGSAHDERHHQQSADVEFAKPRRALGLAGIDGEHAEGGRRRKPAVGEGLSERLLRRIGVGDGQAPRRAIQLDDVDDAPTTIARQHAAAYRVASRRATSQGRGSPTPET